MSQQVNPYIAKFLASSSHALGLAHSVTAHFPAGEPISPNACYGLGRPMTYALMPLLLGLQIKKVHEDQIIEVFREQTAAVCEHIKNARRARKDLGKQIARAACGASFDYARARELANVEAKELAAVMLLRAQSMGRIRQILDPGLGARTDGQLVRRSQGEPS